MAMGSSAIRLSEVCAEFGRKINSQPRNLRSYLKCSTPPLFGFSYNADYGVPEHENNNQIPSSGTLKLSHFRSGATTIAQKYISTNYTSGYVFYDEASYYFGTFFGRGYATQQAAGWFLPAFGGPSSIDVVGQSVSRLGQTVDVIGVFDYRQGSEFDPYYAYFSLPGDRRRSSWDQSLYSITVNIPSISTVTNLFDNAVVPDGFYDASFDVTSWVWNETFNFPISSSYPFTVQIELTI